MSNFSFQNVQGLTSLMSTRQLKGQVEMPLRTGLARLYAG